MLGNGISSEWLKNTVKQSLEDQYCQIWHYDLMTSSKCTVYRIFKNDFCFEKYLTELHSFSRSVFVKFRCRNDKLPVVTGAFNDVIYQNRKCTLCNADDIGDEFHYLFHCTYFINERRELLSRYFYMNPSSEK